MDRLLSSWKEIAAYFGKGVRTVQRWEHTLELPVYRPRGADRNIVFAMESELEAWMRQGPRGTPPGATTILLLLDDSDFRRRMTEILEEQGYLVTRGRHTMDSFQSLLSSCPYDLVICDNNTSADPWDITAHTRLKRHVHKKTLLLANEGFDTNKQDAYMHLSVEVLLRPFRDGDVVEAVRRLTGNGHHETTPTQTPSTSAIDADSGSGALS